jgi:VWFA-related protein
MNRLQLTHTLLPLLGLLTLSATLRAQQDPKAGWNGNPPSIGNNDNILTLHTGVQLVLQDITVTDAAGHPVTGLKQEDFRIFEDGRPQTIKNFEERAPVDPALARQRADELAHRLPPNTFTNYKAFSGGTLVVFLLDTVEEHGCGSGPDAQMSLRQGMLDYMKSVPPGTPFIILQLDRGLHMVQDMTTDVEALQTAVHGKRDFPESVPQLAAPGSELADANLRRRQIVTAAMKQLKQYLGAIPGRKNLVWFSSPLYTNLALLLAGTPPTEWKSYPTFAAYMANITASLQQSRIAIYQMQGTPVGGTGGPSMAATPEDIKAATEERHPGWGPDPVMAEMFLTQPVCNYPQAKERIAAIVDHSQHYYTISYTPTNQSWSDKPRQFSVQLADPTLHLDYRRSYIGSSSDTTIQRVAAPAVQTAAAATVLHDTTGPSPTLQTAMGMGAIEPTQVIFEASATPARTETKDSDKQAPAPGNFLPIKFRKQGYRNYTVHFRVRADELKLTPSADGVSYAGNLDLVAVVYDNQGQAVNGKRERTSISFADLSDPALQAASITGDLTIEVPIKGSYFLRLGVRDAATDRVGALEIPIDRIPLTHK